MAPPMAATQLIRPDVGVDAELPADPAADAGAADAQEHRPEPVHRVAAGVEQPGDGAGDEAEDGVSDQPMANPPRDEVDRDGDWITCRTGG